MNRNLSGGNQNVFEVNPVQINNTGLPKDECDRSFSSLYYHKFMNNGGKKYTETGYLI
jgi:ATP-dependent protease HslVU (ClpYQ) ATPase subunit